MNAANLLTLGRILVIPPVLLCLWLDTATSNVMAFVLFSIACITDFLDGYLARRWDQVSVLGRILDPIADKLLVSLTILMLTSLDRIQAIHLLPALVILSREILVSGLREYLSELQVLLPVSTGAKWKTATQMVAIAVLVLHNGAPWWLPAQTIGLLLLWGSAVLTLVTAYEYSQAGIRSIRGSDHARGKA